MEIVDRVLFRLPQDLELQFPAIAVLQAFVNEYDANMAANNVSPEKVDTYKLQYAVDMATADWEFFVRLGLVLTHQPVVELDAAPHMVVDYSDDKLNHYQLKGKHVGQLCGSMLGIACPPIPVIRRVASRKILPFRWAVLESVPFSVSDKLINDTREFVPADAVLYTLNGQLTGVVGVASRETYAIASMGLPVVEIVPASRPLYWLSKFSNIGYRAVVADSSDLAPLLEVAMEDLEALCIRQVQPDAA